MMACCSGAVRSVLVRFAWRTNARRGSRNRRLLVLAAPAMAVLPFYARSAAPLPPHAVSDS
jgi:hypothetical protein